MSVDSVIILSGGMDSTTLLYELVVRGNKKPLALSFDYGQRHGIKELACAHRAALALELEHRVIDLTSVTDLLKGSALTDSTVAVPDGNYAWETMQKTIVPNRNAIMLNIAAGIAIGQGANEVFTAVHAGDHAIYPDCRPQFIFAMNELLPVATETGVKIGAPYIEMSKANIVSAGDGLTPWEHTWSCYKGGDQHCGKCGTCVERREAFSLAGVVDPTPYEDMSEYWKEVTV